MIFTSTPTLTEEKAKDIMKERGYTDTARSGDGNFIFFSKPTIDPEVFLHAKVDIKGQRIDVSCPYLKLACNLNTTYIDFYHKEFKKWEDLLLFYVLRCRGKEVGEAVSMILGKKDSGWKAVPADDPKPKKTLEDRKASLWEQIRQAGKKKGISKEEGISFYNYWTEMNPGGKKMRFEMENVFDVSRRIDTWIKNNKNWRIEKKSFIEQKAEKQNTEKETTTIDKKKLF